MNEIMQALDKYYCCCCYYSFSWRYFQKPWSKEHPRVSSSESILIETIPTQKQYLWNVIGFSRSWFNQVLSQPIPHCALWKFTIIIKLSNKCQLRGRLYSHILPLLLWSPPLPSTTTSLLIAPRLTQEPSIFNFCYNPMTLRVHVILYSQIPSFPQL